MCSAANLFLFLAVLLNYHSSWILGQNLQEQDGICNAEGCYSLHLQRKTFRESWRYCKENGGSLASVKRPEDATLIRNLLSRGDRRGIRPKLRLWIGLHRQPRQCSATRPLRGFTWITGDQETKYINWLREESPGGCAAPRCVAMFYNTTDKTYSDQNNFKWLDGACMVAVEGFLCHYTYQGMCPALQSEGNGPAVYTTTFHLVSTLLTHIPFGSVGNLPCPHSTKGNQSVLCMQHEDGRVGWSKDAPLCSDAPKDWCKQDNGGCAHYCVNADTLYYCECSEDFKLGDDGQSCEPLDPCHSADCEFDCESASDGYQCKCPEGYLLAQDGLNCLDIDECLQNPCPHICVNAPGTFECRCNEGFQLSEYGECLDVDECIENNCEQICENSPGNYICHCNKGFVPQLDDPDRCEDVDECQIPGTCAQICINYDGSFECSCEEGYELQQDKTSCLPVEEAEYETTTEPVSLTPFFTDVTDYTSEWLTDQMDLGWFTDVQPEDHVTPETNEWTKQTNNVPTSGWLMKAITSSTPHGLNGIDESRVLSSQPEDTKENRYSTPSVLPRRKEDTKMVSPSSLPNASLPSASGQEKQPEGKKKPDRSWLLVALLVPLCVFIVIMLALGIVYCTSCAVDPSNKSLTDCYTWTSNSKSAKSQS